MRNNGKFSSLSLTHSFATIIADGKHKHFIKITTKTRGKSSQSNQEEEEKSFIIFMLKAAGDESEIEIEQGKKLID